MMSSLAINGSNSTVCDSINYVCKLYSIDKHGLCTMNCISCRYDVDDDGLQKSGLVADLINLRDWNFDYELECLIDDLCTE